MRILHLNLRYWPVRSGDSIYLMELSKRLAAHGHEVQIVTSDALDFELIWDPRGRRITQEQESHCGVEIRRFPLRHLPGSRLAYPGLRRLLILLSAIPGLPVGLLGQLARFTPWLPAMEQWLRTTQESYDLVMGMNICFESILQAGQQLAQRQGIPFVVTPLTHLGAGKAPAQDSNSRLYTMGHQIELVRRSQGAILQTQSEADFYRHQGVDPQKLRVVGAGVNPHAVRGGDGERFRQRHTVDGPLIACVGAMNREKGTLHLVDAVRHLWRSGQHLHLALLGDVRQDFATYLSAIPREEQTRLHVLGPAADEEKRDLLAAADLFVLPSRTDSFGIVYLEAWLCGLPVIGAQAWGMADVISHGQDGLLIPYGDSAALAQAITWLLENPQERAAMGQRGCQKTLTSHTWDQKFAQVSALYDELVARKSTVN